MRPSSSPTPTLAIGQEPPVAGFAGERQCVDIAGHTASGKPVSVGGFTVGISGPARVSHTLSPLPDGSLRVHYTPPISGKWAVRITYRGTPLAGSPFVQVIAPARTALDAGSPSSPGRPASASPLALRASAFETPRDAR
mgnify:CR=1 FL=1